MKKLIVITLSLLAISALAVKPGTPAYRAGRGYPNGVPDSFKRNQPRYSSATWLHVADGWLSAIFAVVPDGETMTSQSWSLVDGVMMQSIVSSPTAEVEAAAEAAMQATKSDELKAVENRFFALSATLGLSGRPTFTEISAALETLQITSPDAAVVASLQLLSIDAEAKREGGLDWWDSAAVHELPE